MSIIVAVFNNCCNVSLRSAVRDTGHNLALPPPPMAVQPRLAPHRPLLSPRPTPLSPTPDHGLPWKREETNAVLEARLRKAGIKLPSEETLEELQELAAQRDG